jgi:hypothetical protein
VNFYIDSNSDGSFDSGDTLVGTSDKAHGWAFTVPGSFTSGANSGDSATFFAQVVDDAGNVSTVTSKDSVHVTIK